MTGKEEENLERMERIMTKAINLATRIALLAVGAIVAVMAAVSGIGL